MKTETVYFHSEYILLLQNKNTHNFGIFEAF